jgi:hypothetical protein
VKIRIRLTNDRHVTVHESPGWLERNILRREERDYEAWRINAPGDERAWVGHDLRPVSARVADAIEAELTRACVGNRLRLLRGGQ